MNKYKFLYLFWLIPAYFLFLGLQQSAIYYGLKSTYEHGESYIAQIKKFEIERIAGQRQGRVTIKFKNAKNQPVEMTLGVAGETTSRLSKLKMVPIRYKEEAFVEVVFMPVVELQRGFVLSNMAMAAVAFIITFFIGLWAHRKAKRLSKTKKKELIIERME